MTSDDYTLVNSANGDFTKVFNLISERNRNLRTQLDVDYFTVFNQISAMMLVSMWKFENDSMQRQSLYEKHSDWRKVDDIIIPPSSAYKFCENDATVMKTLVERFDAYTEWVDGDGEEYKATCDFDDTFHLFQAYYVTMDIIRTRASKRMLIW